LAPGLGQATDQTGLVPHHPQQNRTLGAGVMGGAAHHLPLGLGDHDPADRGVLVAERLDLIREQAPGQRIVVDLDEQDCRRPGLVESDRDPGDPGLANRDLLDNRYGLAEQSLERHRCPRLVRMVVGFSGENHGTGCPVLQ
jgi:hypothetical protein